MTSPKPVVRIQKLPHFKGALPAYHTAGASGSDVCAALENTLVLKPGERGLVPTGLVLEIPDGFEIQVRPRSGLAIKNGIGLVNAPGTIDCDYRGELKIIVINLGQEAFAVEPAMRIAQLVLAPVVQASFEVTGDVSATARGAGGFGSTGITSQKEA